MLNRILFDDVTDLRRSFDQFFDSVWNTTPARTTRPTAEYSFMPPIESGWTEEYLNLRMVVPGVTEKDLQVTVQGNQLYLQGERKAPENFGKDGYVWKTIPYGKFERVVDLPAGLDVEKLDAHLHDGFLDIRIPLASAMKPKQISISTSTSSRSDAKKVVA